MAEQAAHTWSGGPRRRLLAGLVAAAAVLAVAIAVVMPAGSARRPLPAFSLPAATGGPPLSYTPPRRGALTRPMVLAFFASWCIPCHQELPMLAHQVDLLRRHGTPIRFVAIDGNDTTASGVAFARHAGVTFPVAEDQAQVLARRIGVVGLPTTVFVDRQGDIVHTMQGSGFSTAQFRHWARAITRS